MRWFDEIEKKYPKTWSEFLLYTTPEADIDSFRSQIGFLLSFFDERGIIINAKHWSKNLSSTELYWMATKDEVYISQIEHKDRNSALKEGIIKSFEIIEKDLK